MLLLLMVFLPHIWLMLILMPFPGQANQRYLANIEQSRWELQGSPIRCELIHTIPRYGQGSFVYSAGGELSFIIRVMQPAAEDSVASMMSIPPFWRSGMEEKELGQVSLSKGRMPFYADRIMAQRMLYELDAGMFPTLVYKDWTDKRHDVTVSLSSANFNPALPQFLNCIDQLIDIGYDDLKEVAVLFALGKHTLSKQARSSLENLTLYARYDKNIIIRLEGHTDNTGTRRYNRWLSDKRTQAVANYLAKSGVSQKQIKRLVFGESKPASGNHFDKGRDLNRRVMVQFERLP
ncbi:MAG: OmpA family protein [Gammaproteobacteria bacterium]